MNKASSLILLSVMLVGCDKQYFNTPNWERDCHRNYSENSYEFHACMDRARKQAQPTPAGSTVSVDPENVNRPASDEQHKSRD